MQQQQINLIGELTNLGKNNAMRLGLTDRDGIYGSGRTMLRWIATNPQMAAAFVQNNAQFDAQQTVFRQLLRALHHLHSIAGSPNNELFFRRLASVIIRAFDHRPQAIAGGAENDRQRAIVYRHFKNTFLPLLERYAPFQVHRIRGGLNAVLHDLHMVLDGNDDSPPQTPTSTPPNSPRRRDPITATYNEMSRKSDDMHVMTNPLYQHEDWYQ